MISSTQADWSREAPRRFWDPSRKLLKSIRQYQNAASVPWVFRWYVKKKAIVSHRFWSVVTGADIPLNSKIGGGLMMPHPNGIVIHPGAEIGVNCLLFQQVTIGAIGKSFPTLGGHVDIGAGAKIIGGVKLGDHAKVGANAVVLKDVAPGTTAVGTYK